jgi:RNA polymerase sigma-70 factor (ECF subfamily)
LSTPSFSILARVATGDPAAMRECLARYGALVWSLARRHCASDTEAEDATQDVFIDVWKSARLYDAGIASETAFIAMIARRRLVDRRRRSARRIPEAAGEVPEAVDARPTPETCAEAAMAAEVLAQLRPEQREVIRLATCCDLTHDEIARRTGMPLGTVKAHARRGLLRVRAILLGLEDQEAPS